MTKSTGISLYILAAAYFTLIANGCGKDGNSAHIDAGGTSIGGSTSSNGPSDYQLKSVLCTNPIVLDEPGLPPLLKKGDFPRANFKLTHMQMYMEWQSTSNSFVVSADDSENFSVKLECNGVQHDNTSSHSEKLSGTFDVGEKLTLKPKTASKKKRILKVQFNDGNLIEASSDLILDSSPNEKPKLDGTLDRIQVVDDGYVTYRIYAPSSRTLELRVKTEYPADENGYRTIQFSRAVYTRI